MKKMKNGKITPIVNNIVSYALIRILGTITLWYALSIMYDIDFEQNIVILSTDSVDWIQVFNKIKPNLKEFYCENLLNICFNYII